MKLKLALFFFFLGLFSKQWGDLITYLWMDNLECYSIFTSVCNLYDSSKEIIISKIISCSLYYIGLNGMIGTLLWYLEDRFIKGWLSKILDKFYNIFGITIGLIITFYITSKFGQLLHLQEIFEFLYKTINL